MARRILHHQNVTKAFWNYYVLAIPFTLTALAGLLAIGGAAYAGWVDVRWAWAVLLAGTVPHMILLDHWAGTAARRAFLRSRGPAAKLLPHS